MLLKQPILFLSGKGGVGKTTVAAAVALTSARAGLRTLLVSTDPAHNLGDLFGIRFGGTGIQKVTPALDALEIDTDSECHRYLDGVKDNMRLVVRSTMIEKAERQINLFRQSPGVAEAALLERVVAVLLEERNAYDRVVFDTAPTGHTMRLLVLPDILATWVEGLLIHRAKRNRDRARWLGAENTAEDPVFALLRERHDRLAEASRMLADSNTTGFIFVLIAEALAIAETRRGIDELASHHVLTSGLIINQLLPEDVIESFFRRRLERQRDYLRRVDREFPGISQIRLPLLDRDVNSPAALEKLLRYISSC